VLTQISGFPCILSVPLLRLKKLQWHYYYIINNLFIKAKVIRISMPTSPAQRMMKKNEKCGMFQLAG
jgi:hypothetical protein